MKTLLDGLSAKYPDSKELIDTINQNSNRPKTVIRDQNGKIVGVQ